VKTCVSASAHSQGAFGKQHEHLLPSQRQAAEPAGQRHDLAPGGQRPAA